MLMEAIGLALCRHGGYGKDYLFRMPAFAALDQGDSVIVETKNGEKEAVVMATATIYGSDSDEYQMIVKAAGASLPLKRVLKRVVCHELDYHGEDADE